MGEKRPFSADEDAENDSPQTKKFRQDPDDGATGSGGASPDLNSEQMEDLKKLDKIRPLVNYLLRMASKAEELRTNPRDALDPCIVLGVFPSTPVQTVQKLKRLIGFQVHPDRYTAAIQTFPEKQKTAILRKLNKAFSLINNSTELLIKRSEGRCTQIFRMPIETPPYAEKLGLPDVKQLKAPSAPFIRIDPPKVSPEYFPSKGLKDFSRVLQSIGSLDAFPPFHFAINYTTLESNTLRLKLYSSTGPPDVDPLTIRSVLTWCQIPGPAELFPSLNYGSLAIGPVKYDVYRIPLPMKLTYTHMPIPCWTRPLKFRLGIVAQDVNDRVSRVLWHVFTHKARPPEEWTTSQMINTISKVQDSCRPGQPFHEKLKSYWQWNQSSRLNPESATRSELVCELNERLGPAYEHFIRETCSGE